MATLTSIINQTPHNGRFKKLEQAWHLNNSGWIPPGQIRPTDISFPWVHTLKEFIDKVLIIELLGKIRFYVWEADGILYVSQTDQPGAVTPYLEEEPTAEEDPFIDADPQLFYRPQIAKGDYKAQEKWIYIRHYGKSFELVFKKPS